MPQRLHHEHWPAFLAAAVSHSPQATYGSAPAKFAARNGITAPGLSLPVKPLTRQQVRRACCSGPLLHGYICAMAWGKQDAGPGGKHHAKAAWAQRKRIARLLTLLRHRPNMSRQQAYDLFVKHPVHGLGPAYFTKLIYFFDTKYEPDRYIMDQWTAKSVVLITQQHVARLAGHALTGLNCGQNYDSFCRVIDFFAVQMKKSGQNVEELLFSSNAQNRRTAGDWRAYVKAVWEAGRPAQRYDHQKMLAWISELEVPFKVEISLASCSQAGCDQSTRTVGQRQAASSA